MKKIVVSQDRCIGCGACVAIDPEHFEFNDEGKSTVVTNENIESANLVNAMESCPTSAIEIANESTVENHDTLNTDDKTDITSDENCTNCHEENCECENCSCEDCHHQDEN